jgi:glutaredoxin-like protein NrdH
MKQNTKVRLYALSTCVWCKRTKRLLDKLGVDYDCVDVDLLDDRDEARVMQEVDRFNPGGGFPLIVINDSDIIAGFDEERIRQTFE